MSWRSETHCVVCGQRVSTANFLPYCCEVCCDSDWAHIKRMADHDDWWEATDRGEE